MMHSILGNVHDSDLDYLTDTFRISASDIQNTATQDFQIIVNGANDAPVLVERETISETTNNIANETTVTATEFFARETASSGINEIISTTD